MNRYILFVLILIILVSSVGCATGGQPMSPGVNDSNGNFDSSMFYGCLDFVWNDEENGYFVYEKDNNPLVDIVIPESYDGKPVVGIGKHAFGAYSMVRNVIVPTV